MKETPFGRYTLLRRLAVGGMAEVFLARERGEAGFTRELAIKRLFGHLAAHEPSLESFQLEARLMSELRHPHIPYVTELGRHEGAWYIAMEYIEGATLAEAWRAGSERSRPMPLGAALGVVLQVAEALEHAHKRRDRAGRSLSIVHRDVTPHNILLHRDGVAKLIDFGVAFTTANPFEQRGLVRGTYSYMAPEQVRGLEVDGRADVFALGVILYELTTGARLFEGSEIDVITSVVEKATPRPSARIADYPPALEELVMGALEKDPTARLSSARELSSRLEDFASSQGLRLGARSIAAYLDQVLPSEEPFELTRRRGDAVRPATPVARPAAPEAELPGALVADSFVRGLHRKLEDEGLP